MIRLTKVLVATDFGDAAEVALAYGRELGRCFGATLDVLHVADNVYTRVGVEGLVAAYSDMQKEIEDNARA